MGVVPLIIRNELLCWTSIRFVWQLWSYTGSQFPPIKMMKKLERQTRVLPNWIRNFNWPINHWDWWCTGQLKIANLLCIQSFRSLKYQTFSINYSPDMHNTLLFGSFWQYCDLYVIQNFRNTKEKLFDISGIHNMKIAGDIYNWYLFIFGGR